MISQKKPILLLDIGNVLFTVNMDYVYSKLVESQLFDSTSQAFCYMKAIEQIQNLGIASFDTAMLYQYTFNNISKFSDLHTVNSIWLSDEAIIPNKVILDYVESLVQDKKITGVVIASNMGIEHKQKIIKSHQLFENDCVMRHFSSDIGSVKPQYNYWQTLHQRIINKFDFDISDSLIYVDDRVDFLQGAISYFNEIKCNSLCTYQYDSSQTAEKEFSIKIENIFKYLGEINA